MLVELWQSLIRFCSDPRVRGDFQKLDRHFINTSLPFLRGDAAAPQKSLAHIHASFKLLEKA